MSIDPTAIIHPQAHIGQQVHIGPYCVIHAGAQIADGCSLASHVIIHTGSILMAHVSIDSFSVIGGNPQRGDFDPATPSQVVVGEHVRMSEGVTIHRSMYANQKTQIGAHSFLMTHAHVGHDCILGEHVTITNNAMLGGHVTIGDYVNIGGGAGIHQFIHIGESAIIGGASAITQNVPPFTMVVERNRLVGLNRIGLKRRHFVNAPLSDIKACYSAVFGQPGNRKTFARQAIDMQLAKTPQGEQFLTFIDTYGDKGFPSPKAKSIDR